VEPNGLSGRLERVLKGRVRGLEGLLARCPEPTCLECSKSRTALATARAAIVGLEAAAARQRGE
jgi:hypothetical protein